MTSQKIAIGLVAVALFVGSVTAHAAEFGAGVKAYNRGDYATALRIFRQVADQGNAHAQTYLGFMYDTGLGVPQDYEVAVRWYHKAANQGQALSQAKLGWMYHNGFGVMQNYVRAHMWYNLAAARGDKNAGGLRDSLAEKMTPAQIAESPEVGAGMEAEREVRSDVSPMPLAYLAKLLIEKGLITQAEFMQKLSAERAGYQEMLENATMVIDLCREKA